MAGPWDDYAAKPAAPTQGPWSEFAQQQPIQGPAADQAYSHGALGVSMDMFGQGFKSGWGTGFSLSPETEKAAKDYGFFREPGEYAPFKAFNEALVRPAVGALHAVQGAYTGLQAIGAQAGQDVDSAFGDIGAARFARDFVSIPDAFMGSPHPTGIPRLALADDLGVLKGDPTPTTPMARPEGMRAVNETLANDPNLQATAASNLRIKVGDIDDSVHMPRVDGTTIPLQEGPRFDKQPELAAAGDKPTAPTHPFPPDTAGWFDKAGNIRTENLTDKASIAEAIQKTADRNGGFMEQRRGTLSAREISDLSDALGMTPESLNTRKIGEAFNAEQIEAARQLLVQTTNEMHDAARKAGASGADNDILAYALAEARQAAVQSHLSGITAEWGRGGNAFKSLVQEVNQAKATGNRVKDMTGENPDDILARAKAVREMNDPNSVARFNLDARKQGFGDKFLYYYLNGLLSGPFTHTAYAMSNAVFAFQQAALVTPVASAIGAVRHLITGTADRVMPGEALARMWGLAQGTPEAITAGWRAFKAGVPDRLPGAPVQTQNPLVNTRSAMPLGESFLPESAAKALGIGVGVPSRAIGSIHSVFASLGFRTEINAQAWRIASREMAAGKLGAAEPPVSPGSVRMYRGEGAPDASKIFDPNSTFTGRYFTTDRATAEKYGDLHYVDVAKTDPRRMGIVQDANMSKDSYVLPPELAAEKQQMQSGVSSDAFSNRVAELTANPTEDMMEAGRKNADYMTFTQELGDFGKKIQALSNHNVGTKMVLPFVRTPGDIFKAAYEQTPLAVLDSDMRADLAGANGGVARDTAAAKIIVGSSIAGMMSYWTAQGICTGGGPTDRDQRATWLLTNRPYSCRIGPWMVDYRKFGSLGVLMGGSADLHDVFGKVSDEDYGQGGAMLVKAGAKAVVDESFMRGLSDLIEAIQEPDRYGKKYVYGTASTMAMPFSTGMGQIASIMDPDMRSARDFISVLKNKTPGERETLFPELDMWGQPVPNDRAGMGSILAMRHVTDDPVNLEMSRLGIAPAPLERQIQGVKLNDDLYDEYQRTAGPLAKMQLDQWVNSPGWSQMQDFAQKEIMSKTIEGSRASAAAVMKLNHTDIIWDAVDKRLKALGQPVAPRPQ